MCANVEGRFSRSQEILVYAPPSTSFFLSPSLLIPVYLSSCLCLAVYLSYCRSACQFISLFFSVYLFTYMSIYFPFCSRAWIPTADCWHLERAFNPAILLLPTLNFDLNHARMTASLSILYRVYYNAQQPSYSWFSSSLISVRLAHIRHRIWHFLVALLRFFQFWNKLLSSIVQLDNV